MSEKEISEAILTLDVLIDCTKEDGTYYTAEKEWEALEVFKKLHQENKKLQKKLDKAIELLITSKYKEFPVEDKRTIEECWLRYIEQELDK